MTASLWLICHYYLQVVFVRTCPVRIIQRQDTPITDMTPIRSQLMVADSKLFSSSGSYLDISKVLKLPGQDSNNRHDSNNKSVKRKLLEIKCQAGNNRWFKSRSHSVFSKINSINRKLSSTSQKTTNNATKISIGHRGVTSYVIP